MKQGVLFTVQAKSLKTKIHLFIVIFIPKREA